MTDEDASGHGERIISALEDLIRHPENAVELLGQFVSSLSKRELGQDLLEDQGKEADTLQERFVLPVVRQALKRGLDVVRLRLRLQFGTGEAATTGIIVGLIYSLVATAMAVFSNRLRFPNDPPEIMIMPCYTEIRVDLELDSIVVLRLGNIVFRAIFGQN